MRHQERIAFTNWDEVHRTIDDNSVREGEFTTQMVHEFVANISSVAHKTFFTKPTFDHIVSLINQIKYFNPNRPGMEGATHAFFDDLRELSAFIDQVRAIDGSSRLFKLGIFTNFGVYTQFLITVWLSRYVEVVDIELENKPWMTDILCRVEGALVHVHVKDIEEEEKQDRISDAEWAIENIFTDLARKRQDDQYLAVHVFDGVPPAKLPVSHWSELAGRLEEKPQVYTEVFEPSEELGIKKRVEIKIKLDWRPWNSTYTSPFANFNNQERLTYEVNKLIDRLTSYPAQDGDLHILLTTTWDEYDWDEFTESIKDEPVGLLVVRRMGNYLNRSPFILPAKFPSKVKESLEAKIPVKDKLT